MLCYELVTIYVIWYSFSTQLEACQELLWPTLILTFIFKVISILRFDYNRKWMHNLVLIYATIQPYFTLYCKCFVMEVRHIKGKLDKQPKYSLIQLPLYTLYFPLQQFFPFDWIGTTWDIIFINEDNKIFHVDLKKRYECTIFGKHEDDRTILVLRKKWNIFAHSIHT